MAVVTASGGHARALARGAHQPPVKGRSGGVMNQLDALRETVRLAAEVGMPELPGSDVGLAHLRDMAATAEGGDFDEAKLGRWLGWAQCALVTANVGVTLADMKSLNAKWLSEEVAPIKAGPLETDPSWDGAASSLEHYPWVVWTVTLLDPERLAGANVVERTAAAATAAAELYGCVYCARPDSAFRDRLEAWRLVIDVVRTAALAVKT
jgi:hypothetical protein